MFGKVKLENGSLIPVTISGPTDGSTDIVHHECNCDYQLATAYDDQYGAGYLGISDCCKPLYNPRTGKLTVDCADTVSTGVDINNNSNTNTTVKVLVQGQDENCLPTTTIEKSNIDYNANCYVCNDPTTGDPVRKPVTHVSTLCVDELLGVASGVDVCITDCDCNYPIAAFDAATKTVVIGDTNPVLYNPGTASLTLHGISSDECSCVGIGFDGDTAAIIAGDTEFGVDTCDIIIQPACSLKVRASNAIVDCLPYTGNHDSNYELFGRNTTTSEVKKLDGITYDPYTCVMSGRFQGMAFPIICCGTAVGDACPVSGIGMTSNMLELYHGRKTEGGINFCQWLYMNDNCFAIDSNCGLAFNRLRMCQGCLTNTSCYLNNSCSVLTQGMNNFGVSICCLTNNKRAVLNLSTTSGFDAYGTDYSFHLSCDSLILHNCHVSMRTGTCDFALDEITSKGRLHLGCDRVALVYCYADTCTGMYFCKTDRKAYVTDGTNDNRIALMCDITGGGAKPMPGNPGYSSFAEFVDDVYACNGTGGAHGWWVFTNPVTLTDNNTGCSISTGELLGYVGLTSDNTGIFTGEAEAVGGKKYSVTMWISSKAPSSYWTVIAPIPGTMYGTASATGINVEGTV